VIAPRLTVKFGGRIIHLLVQHGFASRIVPITRRRKEIRGCPGYATLADAAPAAEDAILAVPTSQLLPAIEQCAAAGVGCCVITTTGFAEADEAGVDLQQRIVDIAVPAGMRIVGPNCSLHRLEREALAPPLHSAGGRRREVRGAHQRGRVAQTAE
jgi:acyl-CoA synthetase (NDP forming)